MYSVQDSVKRLPGVGDKRAASLERLGILTIGDLLFHFPRGYQNRGETVSLFDAALRGEQGLPSSVMLTLKTNATGSAIRRGMTITKARAVQTDYPESGDSVELVFFNQHYLQDSLRIGVTVRAWGRVVRENRRYKLTSPLLEYYTDAATLARLVPVYPLSAGLSQKYMSGLILDALHCRDTDRLDPLPASVRESHGFPCMADSLRMIHVPETRQEAERARERFAFERIFAVSAALARTGARRPDSGAVAMGFVDTTPFTDALPFSLTGCQERALRDVARDLSLARPMKRMISGDVGSGKTVIAAGAAYITAVAGYTTALMVPTEILARQHYSDIEPLFRAFGMRVALLTGSCRAAEKKAILASLRGEGERIDLVIGTHALISEGVAIRDLGLVITDEQHRFGALQRSALEGKAGTVHTLVMSATPIPRTLTLVMYKDLDISVLDELPPGRLPVSTFTVDESYRERLEGFIKKQAEEGHQTYIVCPAVEEKPPSSPEDIADLFCDDTVPVLKAAVEYADGLRERLPSLRIGVVHGRMKSADKDKVMGDFAAGELDVLVSTTVIEVGVNVPAATLMVVENAERFGLSQLHQLRGRVGRGSAKSYCILVSDSTSPSAAARLDTMCRLRDGFKIAEEDLMQRGPGDFFAVGGHIKQSGAGDQIYSALAADPSLIETAGRDASRILAADPELSLPEHSALRDRVLRLVGEFENIIN